MIQLLASILPLALGAAVSPMLFGIEILAVSSGTKPVLRAWAVVAGAALLLVAYSVVGLVVGSAVHHGAHHRAIDATLDLVAAGLLAVLAIRTFVRRHQVSSKPSLTDRLGDASTLAFLGAGAIGMGTNFSTLVLYLPALREITKASVFLEVKILTAVILLLITLVLIWVPALLVTVLGRRATPALGAMNRWMSAHTTEVTLGIELLFIVLLTFKGVGNL